MAKSNKGFFLSSGTALKNSDKRSRRNDALTIMVPGTVPLILQVIGVLVFRYYQVLHTGSLGWNYCQWYGSSIVISSATTSRSRASCLQYQVQ